MDIKILIIDDSEQDRKIITRFLKKEGYENIVIAETGATGVERARIEKPDIIILDTMLPDSLGFDVCRRIRAITDIPAPKIIMQTGSIDAVDAVRAKEAGVDDYCVKTVDCEPLLEALRGIIPKHLL